MGCTASTDATTSRGDASGGIQAEHRRKHHNLKETAMGFGGAVARATLTPIVGLGFMGVAAHDAISSGIIGTMHKARDLLRHTEKAAVDRKGNEVSSVIEEKSGDDLTRDKNSSCSSRPVGVEATPIQIFHIECANWKELHDNFIEKGIPFVLRRKDGAAISNAAPPLGPDPEDPEGNISVSSDSLKVKYENIDGIIKKLLPRTFRAYWPLWFQGNYKSGLAHVDLGPATINFYCLQRGQKDVVIADYEVTRHLRLKTGIDSLYVPGSSGNHDFLERLSKYYRIRLEENSILVFNNAGCLHHFTNIKDSVTPIALSVRCKHALGSDPRVWLHLAIDPKVWWNMTDHMFAMSKNKPDSRAQDKA